MTKEVRFCGSSGENKISISRMTDVAVDDVLLSIDAKLFMSQIMFVR